MKNTSVPSLRQPSYLLLGIWMLTASMPGISFGQEVEPAPPAAAGEAQEAEILVDLEDAVPLIPGLEPFETDEEITVEPGHATTSAKKQNGQTLLFFDGNTLHGSLAGIDSQRRELHWHRVDASTPITFPLSQITSLSINGNQEIGAPAGKVTVKLTGGDWLSADGVTLKNGKLEIRLGGTSPLVIDRDRVEWLYFARGTAPECYDGPTSMAGWISDGSWTFREGSLRALRPGPIGRHFEALPDQVEYFFELDQNGGFQAFSVNLRSGLTPRGNAQGRIQVMFSANDLRMWAQVGDEMKMEQVDLRQLLGTPGKADSYRPPRNKAVQYRILEDFTGGRLIVFMDGRKVADWKIGKGDAGKNRGGFTFQPMVWNADSQQSLSRIRVLPWNGIVPADGANPDDLTDTDSVLLSGTEIKKGEVYELGANKLKIRNGGTSAEIAREQIRLLRFRRPETPPDEDAAVARVRLARRGEFDVSGMSIRDGQLAARTSFGGEVAFSFAAIRAVEFAGATAPAVDASDMLVFKNGDRLKGTLESAASGHPIRWQANGGPASAEIQTNNILGILLGPRAEVSAGKPTVLARFRNGDILPGDFVGLDAERLLLKIPQIGPLEIPRVHLRALYFTKEGIPPVLSGAMDADLWMSGVELRRPADAKREKSLSGNTAKQAQAVPWRYFNGAYSLQRPDGNPGSPHRGGVYLGRLFEAMPQSVEISFQVTASKNAPTFSVQLFSEPNKPGYMMQCYSEGIFLHDMSPRGNGRAVFQQQFPFDGRVASNAPHRQLRILADRPSGKVTLVVDGVVVGQVVRKPSDGARNLGRGFMVMPQTNISCTFSDFWIGPWNGLVPGREPSGTGEKEHSVLLANGDETRGTTLTASHETVKFESEVGPVELPISRLTMLDLGSLPVKPERGVRLRLVDWGSVTVTSYRIENGNVICQSSIAGELRFPLSSVQEIALTSSVGETASPKKAR